jgi:hypothetical protein
MAYMAFGGIMFKKTTIYLSLEEISLLKKRATTDGVTMAEAIRLSIKESCRPKTEEEARIWNSLDKIWAKTAKISSKKIDTLVGKAVKEVRSDKKTTSRSRHKRNP